MATLNKVTLTGESEVEGAAVKVYHAEDINEDGTVKADAKAVAEWVSEAGKKFNFGSVLDAGKSYVIVETGAPSGYAYAVNIPFTVNLNGTVAVDDSVKAEDGTILVKDDTTKVSITKTDITNSQEIEGAYLALYNASDVDADGNVVDGAMPIDDWTSGLVAHEINGVLDAGASYTLVEIAAPAGYVKASAVTFTVNMDGTVTPVVMEDDTTKVRITKTDITGENEVAGATLTLKDEFGNVVDEWVSTEEAHEINGKLAAGATYTLTETNAPAGYAYATDVVFTVNEDGTVNEVTMSDDVTKVNISKYAQTLDAPLAGAEMLLRDEAGNVVDSWTSTEIAGHLQKKLIILLVN